MLTVSEAAALLRSFDRVLILTHIRPDGDTVGCAAGLCAALRAIGKKDEPELETCFEALYGVLLLRLQKKPISEGTAKAVEAITSFLSMLANYYDKDRKGELKLDE